MPMEMNKVTGDTHYPDPFLTAFDSVDLKIDVSTLTTDEVDSKGYLKPGVAFRLASGVGVLVSGVSQVIFGVNRFPVKLVGRSDNASLSSDTNDITIAVVVRGTLSQATAEAILGRVYSANELAAFAAAGSHLLLR